MKEDGAAEAKEHCQHVRVRYCEGVGNFFLLKDDQMDQMITAMLRILNAVPSTTDNVLMIWRARAFFLEALSLAGDTLNVRLY